MPDYLYNAWYVAALSRELENAPLGRTYLDEPVVLFRQSDGSVAALEDRCCHRHLPLSCGLVAGDRLQCGYHGLEFDASGTCVSVPGQSRVPPGAAIHSYPVVEKAGWIWIWMGDADGVDDAMFPPWPWLEDPAWAVTLPDPFHLACNYRLVTDNVLDTTHLAYVHRNSIGNAAINEFPSKTERTGNRVTMTRWILDRPPPPMYKAAGNFEGNVDRWQIVEHDPPCFSVNDAGCAVAGTGAPEGDRSRGITVKALSAPTPETQSTTHYFFAFVRDFGHGDDALEEMMSVGMVDVFREDVVVFEAQQRMMDLKPNAPSIDINVDAAPLAARKALEEMIAAENASRDAAG